MHYIRPMKLSFRQSKKNPSVSSETNGEQIATDAIQAAIENDKVAKALKKKEKKEKKKRDKGAPRIKAVKGIKVSKKPQFVLTIGDEGAILVYLNKGAVDGRWFAPGPTEENLEVFSKSLAMNPLAPVTVVFDTIDQHYSQQTLPPVSKMSVNGLLKRRAQKEFGRSVELKGNYLLNRTESKEWNYMLYAIETGETIQEWLNWLVTQPNRPKGIRILPLDIATLTQLIAQKEAAINPSKYETKRSWQYLLSYNKVSGVRQVILRDGKMIFTRLGQPLEGDAHTEAGAIEQEIISTVEYLKRIGLKTIHNLHLYIIVGQDVVEAIDTKRIGVEANSLFSPYQVSELLGCEGFTQPEDKFGDVFLAAFVANYKKGAHVLWTRSLNKLRQLYMAIPVLRTGGSLAMLAALAYSVLSGYEYYGYADETEAKQAQLASLRLNVEDLKKQSNLPAEELEKILDLYEIHNNLKKSQFFPDEFFRRISWSMASQPKYVLIQQLEWSVGAASSDAAANPGSTAPPPVPSEAPPAGESTPIETPPGTPHATSGRLHVDILVKSDIKNEELQNNAKEAIDNIKPYLPHYQFTAQDVPGAKAATDAVDIDFSEAIEQEAPLTRVTVQSTFTGTEYIPDPDSKLNKVVP